jgi:hypothetical protein
METLAVFVQVPKLLLVIYVPEKNGTYFGNLKFFYYLNYIHFFSRTCFDGSKFF